MTEQAGKKEGRQASTRKAFSRSHALEGLVKLQSRNCLNSIINSVFDRHKDFLR